MAGSLDLAGVLGTWIAVFFAIVALVGIVGPLILWREATSERYQAITAIKDVDNVFVSKGFPISPNVRLFRTVRVPKLEESKIAKKPREVWTLNRIGNTRFHCGWAKLCQLIKAYNVTGDVGNGKTPLLAHLWDLVLGVLCRLGDRKDKGKVVSQGGLVPGHNMSTRTLDENSEVIEGPLSLPSSPERYATGDALVIRNNKTLLPVHRHWILVLGILGRFGDREDQGKVVSQGSVVPGHHMLTAALDEEVIVMERARTRLRKAQKTRKARKARKAQEAQNAMLQSIIYGTTGSFSLLSPRSQQEGYDIEKAGDIEELRFVLRNNQEIGNPQPDKLSLIELFWLAIGCLPMFDERVFCLDDPPSVPSRTNNGSNRQFLPLKFERVTAWSKPVLDIVEALSGVSNHQLFALHITDSSPLTSLSDIQASNIWTNTGKKIHGKFIFVLRRDVQELARSLLTMHWSSQNYLVGSSSTKISSAESFSAENSSAENSSAENPSAESSSAENSSAENSSAEGSSAESSSTKSFSDGSSSSLICMNLLTEAGHHLNNILQLMLDNYEYLSVANDVSLWALMRKVRYRRKTPGFDQTTAKDLNALDSALREIHKHSGHHERVHVAIATLIITNTEFRNHVVTAAKAMADFAAFPIQFDMSTGSLTLPSLAWGGPEFEAEFDVKALVYGENMKPVTITGSTIMLAALWGCVRSEMLYDTLDSKPLFGFFQRLKDVVNIG